MLCMWRHRMPCNHCKADNRNWEIRVSAGKAAHRGYAYFTYLLRLQKMKLAGKLNMPIAAELAVRNAGNSHHCSLLNACMSWHGQSTKSA